MNKLTPKWDGLHINNKRLYTTTSNVLIEDLVSCFQFAYNVTFGRKGEQRDHRSGGSRSFKNGAIFVNTLTGKLAEYSVYRYLTDHDIECTKPDLNMFELGTWDTADLTVEDIHISVKSSKFFSNLLLLEAKDWDENGLYKPNISIDGVSKYDFFTFVRIKPDGEGIMKTNRWLYNETIDFHELREQIANKKWEYHITGFITHDDLLTVINDEYLIEKDTLLNGRIKMDATNYYVQCGDMNEISLLPGMIDEKVSKT